MHAIPTALELDQLPAPLKRRVQQNWSDFRSRTDTTAFPETVIDSLPRVWAASPFVEQHCLRDAGMLDGLVTSGDLMRAYSQGELAKRLHEAQQAANSQAELAASLRRCRSREAVRIAWRDLAGWSPLEETLGDLTDVAEACIEAALLWLERSLAERHGIPLDDNGQPARLIVIGMGKLGGRELNFSSDVDLIYAYDSKGETNGARPLSHEEYFTRLARQLGQVLSEQTSEGFVCRVDTLLRPFGRSGPLVMHADAVEQYYQIHGREWERYALIKARTVAGDHAAGARLLKALQPFIYRRYLDYSAFDSLRDMKALIEQQLHQKGIRDNIKLGPGGIREVEFIAQAFQLIRGGHDRVLQQRSLLPVIDVLGREGLLPAFAVRALREAYAFLRRTENRLQAWQDQQTHELPQEDERRQALALAMGFGDWQAFYRQLGRHRRRVHQQFELVFAAPHAGTASDAQVEQLSAIWEGGLSDEAALEVLQAQGLPEAGATLNFLKHMRRGEVYRDLGVKGRRRFRQLLPLLIGAVQDHEQPETAMLRVLQVIEAIAGRTTYLALLLESPMALSQLVTLCAASPWITHQICQHPLLLDELLDPRTLYKPPDRAALERELAEASATLTPEDLESQMDLLRRLKQSWVLRVAAADVSGRLPLMIVSDHLTEIAEILVRHALGIARAQLEARHGRPMRADGHEAGFAVIGFGKLGGIELGYGSDLDLVFVHNGSDDDMTDGDKPIDHGGFFTRLTQKLVHLLTAQMSSGVAYEVDLQLRPSGRSGLLVTTLEGYRTYLLERAWTWEHQALLRSRPIAGDVPVAETFGQLRQEVLQRPRDAAKLREDIRSMRNKMLDTLGTRTSARFDLKLGRGGVIDIEFMVQFLLLRAASEHPETLRYSDNIRQLDALSHAGVLEQADAGLLADAYRAYRKRLHTLALQESEGVVDENEFRDYRGAVTSLWHKLIGE